MSQLSEAIGQLRHEMHVWEAKEEEEAKKGPEKATPKQLAFLKTLVKRVGEKKLPGVLKKAGLGADIEKVLKGIKKGEAGKLIGLLIQASPKQKKKG